MDMETDAMYRLCYYIYERAVQDLVELAEWYENNHDIKEIPKRVYLTTGEYFVKTKGDLYSNKFYLNNKYEKLLRDSILTILDDRYDVLFENREKIYKTIYTNIKKDYPVFFEKYGGLLCDMKP